MSLSVAIITKNEEANIRRTLESVKWADEIVVVDSGSTDRTCEIAREYGAKVFVEEWKGFAKQKNSAIEKCSGDWILSLDADEEVSQELRFSIVSFLRAAFEQDRIIAAGGWDAIEAVYPLLGDLGLKYGIEEYWEGGKQSAVNGALVQRENNFLGRFLRHGGFYPDTKLRLFRKSAGHFKERLVHESVSLDGVAGELQAPLIHHAYPTLSSYIEHMNRYSDLGAEMVVEKKAGERGASAGSREQSARAKSLATEPLEKRGKVGFSIINIVLRPLATFLYNYFFRLGFLDGKEGLLLHLYHSVYVSWKYAKAWELSRKSQNPPQSH
jgi:glycosyltransferase involved in cell wall biosynthesis